MNSYILACREDGELLSCSGPLTDTDLTQLFKDNPSLRDEFELIDETIFKTCYPEDYSELIDQEPSNALSVWIERMMDGEREVAIEGDVIGTDNYFIVIDKINAEITLSLLIGCHTAEAVEIAVLIREKLPNFQLIVRQASIFSKIIEN